MGSPAYVVTFTAMSAVMLVVALLASYLPARRASSLNPVQALRGEEVRKVGRYTTFVYVLQSEGDPTRYYTGRTRNVGDRLAARNGGFSVHTADARPWRVIVTIVFADEWKAIRFEKYIKSGSGRAFARRHFR